MANPVIVRLENETKQFGDVVSKFIVSHPKTAALIALVLGNVVGVFLHV